MTEFGPSVGEIAELFGGSPDTIYKWITRNGMHAYKFGRLWKFLASEVNQWVKGGRAAHEPTDVAVPIGPKRRSTKKLG